MEALKNSCEAAGLCDVQTYLQSGNIVFRAPQSHHKKLPALLNARITQDFGFETAVLVLLAKEINLIAEANPLWPKSGGDEKLFHATFLSQSFTAASFKKFKLPTQTGERAEFVERVIYLHCPQGYGKTKLSNRYFEKLLGMSATTRNWRTVLALQEMCARH